MSITSSSKNMEITNSLDDHPPTTSQDHNTSSMFD